MNGEDPLHSILLPPCELVEMSEEESFLILDRVDNDDLNKDANLAFGGGMKGEESEDCPCSMPTASPKLGGMNDEESAVILGHGEKEDLSNNSDLGIRVDKEGEYMMDEDSDEMIGEYDMEKVVKNDIELTKDTNEVIGGEQARASMKEEVNCEQNACKVMNEEVKNEKQVKPNSKSKVVKLRRTGKKKTVMRGSGSEQAREPMREEMNCEENADNVMNEDLKNEKQVETNSKSKVDKLRRRGKTKIVMRGIGGEQAVEPMKEEVNCDENADKVMNEELKNEKQVKPNSKGKVDKLRRMGKKEMVLRGVGGKQAGEPVKEEVNCEETADKVMNEEAKNEKQVKPNSKRKVYKLRRRKKKIVMTGRNNEVAKFTNGQESLGRRLTMKDKSRGMIFMCSSKTKQDCYRHKVFGLPAGKRDIVLKIEKGMKLFLFDFDSKLLYGIYKAAGPGGYNIEPNAFRSAFPSQVRFKVYEECLPLPEEKFKKVIKDNYYQKKKFDSQLTSEQVKNLCKLFLDTSKSFESKWLHSTPKAERNAFMDRERTWRQQHRAEPCINVNQNRRNRKRHRGEESYHTYGRHEGYKERHYLCEREVYASLEAPPRIQSPLSPLSGTVLPPSYTYEGNLEMNVYRRDPFLQQQSRPFLDLELSRQRQIEPRMDLFAHQRDVRFLDTEFRHGEEIECYRAQPLLHDLSYAAAQPSEYRPRRHILHPTSLLPGYRPLQPAYQY